MSDFWTMMRVSFDIANEAINKFDEIMNVKKLKIPDSDIISIILLYFVKQFDNNELNLELLKTSTVEYFNSRPKTKKVNLEKIKEVIGVVE